MASRFYKICLFIMCILIAYNTSAQAKKPTLMIFPSDNWCIQRYFYKEINNQGNIIKTPDYKKAFQEDQEIGQVISKIGSLMIEKGFPLKDAENELKNLERQNAIDQATSNGVGNNELNISILDRILSVSKSDVLIQIWWQINKNSIGNKEAKFTLEALDSYTNKRIAASTGIKEFSALQSTPELLALSIENNIELFTNQIQDHFNNLLENGREVKLQIKVFKDWGKNLDTDFQNKALNEIIEEWLQANTVKSKFNIATYTDNLMNLEEVKIPVLDNKSKGVDARSFIRNLQNFLKEAPYSIPSKIISTGIGDATIILGDK